MTGIKWLENMRWTENDISCESDRCKTYIDSQVARGYKLLLDEHKNKRIIENMCKYCFYNGWGVAGQAMTEWRCRYCLKDYIWDNTNHPLICNKCAQEHTLCIKCGADIHLRVRRINKVKK